MAYLSAHRGIGIVPEVVIVVRSSGYLSLCPDSVLRAHDAVSWWPETQSAIFGM